MNCGVGLSLGLATVALIRSLGWEPPYAAREALKRKKEKKKREREREKRKKKKFCRLCVSTTLYIVPSS